MRYILMPPRARVASAPSAIALVLALLASLGCNAAHAYYGARSTEARLKFRATADIPWPRGASSVTPSQLNAEGAARDRALEKIDAQVQHLMGTFQSESFREKFGYPGVLGESYQVKFNSAQPSTQAGRLSVSYDFEGKVAFEKSAFQGGPNRNVPIIMPLSADRIYEQSLDSSGNNPCTDPHYNSEGDFWYFWDPGLPRCPLLTRNSELLVKVIGTLERLPNTRSTYPEYDRLYGANGNGDLIRASVFFGYIEDIESIRVPVRRDDAKTAFRYVEQDLKSRGFELKESRNAFREYSDGRIVAGINFLRIFEKQSQIAGRTQTFQVRLLLADTTMGSPDITFHRHLEDAFENSDLVIYDGHSGLGSNLDLANLPPIRFKPSKYQIYFFNGCSTYPYFRGSFFKAKKGSQNLEIITSGLPTYANTSGPNAIAFLRHFLEGQTHNYQTILRDIEESNAEMGTYLMGVSGDEDNAWHPSHQ